MINAIFGNIGILEILLVVLVLILIFGAKRIPEIARSLRKTKDEFSKIPEDSEKK